MYDIEELEKQIRNVPGFPVEGVVFKDITTLLSNPGSLGDTVAHLLKACEDFDYDSIAAIESRGFIFGAVMAVEKNVPLALVRKPGKLPAETVSREYTLEYGTATVELHRDALPSGSRVLIVDDLIATGGSATAASRLVREIGCTVAGAAFVMDLTFLGGGDRLRKEGFDYVALMRVDSEG